MVFATNNEHKLREVSQIVGDKIEILSLAQIGCTEDIPEDADTLEGNALQKARYVAQKYGVDCFADDTGLHVDALDGGPGVFTARFGTMNGFGDSHDATANIRCLLSKMEGKENRQCRFHTVIALVCHNADGSLQEHLFEGIVEGSVVTELRGENGFGYDPVFEVEETGLTFAEMGPEGKNAVSHRARAVAKLAKFIQTEPKVDAQGG
jgi:XTP/dITP diphosphohydrolase